LQYLKLKIISSLVVFFLTINLDFILPRLVPGSAAEIFASGTKLPSAAVQLISARLGLNQPLYIQYYMYLKDVFTSWPPYFGISYQYYPEPASVLILSRLPWTLFIICTSLVISFGISFIMVGLTTLRRGGKLEFASIYFSVFLWSMPPFFTGMVLLFVFSVYLKWTPIFGNTGLNAGVGLGYIFSVLRHAILPIITLTMLISGYLYILLRGATQEVLKNDFVLAAKARGFSVKRIAFGYVIRNSLLPIVSLTGYLMAILTSADVLVESVFGYPGVGDLIVDAIYNRDYPVLEGSFFYITVIVIVLSLLSDYISVKLDPRVK
jgi:peptide/nickel transport system permease protein